MKISFLPLMLIFLFFSCQENSVQTFTENKKFEDDNLEKKIFELSLDEFSPAIIVVPKSGVLGATRTILFNNQSYLIGNETDPDIRDYIFELPSGETPVEIKGIIGRETGHYPNPTVEFDVIGIKDLVEVK